MKMREATHPHGAATEREREDVRCAQCPFITKKYATREECGNCPRHEEGCKDFAAYQEAITLASTIV